MGRERKFFEENEAGGHHVTGERGAQHAPQRIRSAFPAGAEHHVGDELNVMVRRLTRADNGPLHFGLIDQRVFDFGHLNAVAMNLDPRVLAPHEHERTVRCAAAQCRRCERPERPPARAGSEKRSAVNDSFRQ